MQKKHTTLKQQIGFYKEKQFNTPNTESQYTIIFLKSSPLALATKAT
jgi:hypothetical protein